MTSKRTKPGQVALNKVNLVVGDMAAAVDFYRLLGLVIPATEASWDEHHRSVAFEAEAGGELDFDLDSRPFAAYWGGGADESAPTGPVLGFGVATRSDVDRLYQQIIAAGHAGRRAPYNTFWGARYAIVEDPDGTPIGLMSPPNAADRTSPPSPAEFAR